MLNENLKYGKTSNLHDELFEEGTSDVTLVYLNTLGRFSFWYLFAIQNNNFRAFDIEWCRRIQSECYKGKFEILKTINSQIFEGNQGN